MRGQLQEGILDEVVQQVAAWPSTALHPPPARMPHSMYKQMLWHRSSGKAMQLNNTLAVDNTACCFAHSPAVHACSSAIRAQKLTATAKIQMLQLWTRAKRQQQIKRGVLTRRSWHGAQHWETRTRLCEKNPLLDVEPVEEVQVSHKGRHNGQHVVDHIRVEDLKCRGTSEIGLATSIDL